MLIALCSGAMCFPAQSLRAQESPERLDSILPLLDPAVKDTNQLALLITACESWYTSDEAYPYLARLDALSAELLHSGNAAVRKRAHHARGAFHFFTGYHAKFDRNVPLALRSFHAALKEFEEAGAQNALGEVHDALGVLHRAVGDGDQALASFREELRLARAIHRKHLLNQALVHLAAVHADRKEYERAITLLDSCGPGGPADSSAAMNERARIEEDRGHHAEAVQLWEQSLSIAKRSDNPWDQLPVLAPLARAHYAHNEANEGLAAARACVAVAAPLGDQAAHCCCIVLTGIGEIAMGRDDLGEIELRKGFELAQRYGNVGASRELGDEGSMVHAAGLLKDLLQRQGRTAEALAMTNLWVTLKDSVERMNGRDELMLLEFRRQLLRDSLEQVAKAERERAEHRQQLSTERTRRNLIGVIGCGAALLAVGIWSRLRFVRRTRDRILSTQQQLVTSEKEREAEQVRTRIARDVHDELGSDLTKLALLGNEAKRRLASEPAAAMDVVERMGGISRQANAALSDIVWAVDPHHDTMRDLVEHARAHTLRMLEGTGIESNLSFTTTDPDKVIDPATKRDIFLLLKEALNNVVKHAKAANVAVTLRLDRAGFFLRVQDDGHGFDPAGSTTDGNGLNNMRSRSERLNSVLQLHSAPDMGTTLEVRGPLDPR